jgi:hypothetical protein
VGHAGSAGGAGGSAPRGIDGARVALGGAWVVDAERRWAWEVDKVTPLAASSAKEPVDPPAEPGHEIALAPAPAGAKPISQAREGELATFQLVGPPPLLDGDGWPVADALGKPVVALLHLPGERASFGAQDLRAPHERWQLRRGVTYWVRLGKSRKGKGDRPPHVNARTAPVRTR